MILVRRSNLHIATCVLSRWQDTVSCSADFTLQIMLSTARRRLSEIAHKCDRVVPLKNLTAWKRVGFILLLLLVIAANLYNLSANIEQYSYSRAHPTASPTFNPLAQTPAYRLIFCPQDFLQTGSLSTNVSVDCLTTNTNVWQPCGTVVGHGPCAILPVESQAPDTSAALGYQLNSASVGPIVVIPWTAPGTVRVSSLLMSDLLCCRSWHT